ncbi:MAG: DUF5317 domain-containing protein [Angelakisella sp.]|nr:DUF5317 domain-containing protein [Angelakisella sp.]
MLLAYVVIMAVAVALLRGGSLKKLGMAPIYWLWLPIAAFALEAAIGPMVLYIPVHYSTWLWMSVLGSYLLLGTFLVRNRHLKSMKLLMIGTVLSFIVISANQWKMPVSTRIYDMPALAPVLEKITTGTLVEYTVATDATRFLWLGDVIPVDFIPGMSFGSIGDMFLAVGIFWLVLELIPWHRPMYMASHKKVKA